MAKVKITYRDVNKDAPEVEIGGIKLKDGESGEIEEDIAKRFKDNPWFEVAGGNGAPAAKPAPAPTTAKR